VCFLISEKLLILKKMAIILFKTKLLSKLFFLALMLLFFIPFNAFGDSLKADLDTYLKKLPAGKNVSVYLEVLKNGQKYLKNPGQVVPAASIIKIPVMVEVMEQVKEKKFKLTDSLLLKSSDKVQGGGLLKNQKNNTRVTIERLVFLMITESDNTATNMLIKKVGMDSINNRMKKLGLAKTSVEMLIFDLRAYARGKDNRTTASETALLLKKIYRQEVATPDLCRFMLEILKRNKNKNAIPKFLKGVPVAHKTGSLSGIQGDAGIIYSSNPYILSVFIRGLPATQAEGIIAEIARISFNSLNSP
jgi:beta-lactamase class A